jgi:hypothetical protein
VLSSWALFFWTNVFLFEGGTVTVQINATGRRIIDCSNCGQTKEHAAKGLCDTCYRAETRALRREKDLADRLGNPDRNNPAIRKEHLRISGGLHKFTQMCEALRLPLATVRDIRQQIEPFLSIIQAELLDSTVDSGHENVAVHDPLEPTVAEVAESVVTGPSLVPDDADARQPVDSGHANSDVHGPLESAYAPFADELPED